MLRLATTTLRASRLRHASTSSRPPLRGRRIALGSGLVLTTLLTSKIYADSAAITLSSTSKEEPRSQSPMGTLVRSYVVYTMCSMPALVDNAPWLLETLTSIPGVRWITEAIVRVTFFDQFVGGDTAEKTLPLLQRLRQNNTGTLFAHSVEVDEAEAMAAGSSSADRNPHREIVKEMIHCIDIAADFEQTVGAKETGRRTWVAVKITALLPDASALIRLSKHILTIRPPTTAPHVAFPGNPTVSDLDVIYAPSPAAGDLTPSDLSMLRTLHADLEAICTRAQERGVRVIIDAEYSWYQPALDALTLALMRRFNALDTGSTQPLVYATYQAYLRRTPAHLVHALRDAKRHGFALGVKLVRGAYHTHESAAHPDPTSSSTAKGKTLSISPDVLPPVWAVKRDTDATYDACASLLLDAVAADIQSAPPGSAPHVGVLFGTHNWASAEGILRGLEDRGLVVREKEKEGRLVVKEQLGERVTFGQLYGMCDDLTETLANRLDSNAPMVIKYIPYGALSEVMPYLSRRAIENKSVLGPDGGAAKRERDRAWGLIWNRLFGG
ncbi:FAD-linked oxidoreductase [Roridomyces roridus]|uniref:Proline dehydrogenase n=1 Tax=Roridomyces roridus TaxID=1738132 RepID=A0AAD7FCT5_9AGAR|nr:FAD-linked oxidoreductase [Roridomyces roridus]